MGVPNCFDMEEIKRKAEAWAISQEGQDSIRGALTLSQSTVEFLNKEMEIDPEVLRTPIRF